MTDDTNNTAPDDTPAEAEEAVELATPEDPATPVEETAPTAEHEQAAADEPEETTAAADAEVEDRWYSALI